MAERKGRARARKLAEDPEAPPPSLGGQAVQWMEEYLIHGPGPVQGMPYRLHDDLKLFTWKAYEVRGPESPRPGKHKWTEAVLECAKGIAKSEFGGALTCLEGLGPVQFDGWDANGDPVGRPMSWVEILVFANDEEQAGNLYLNTATMLDPEQCTQALLDDYGEIDIGRTPESSTRTVLPDNRGEIKPQTARARSKEGGKPTFIALEETHLWTLPPMHALHQTNRRSLRKPSGRWMCHFTNTFGPGEGSVLELLEKDHHQGAPILWFGGKAANLPDGKELRELPDAVLLAGLKEAYGSATYVDLHGIIEEVRLLTTDDAHARRFFFNIKASSKGKWMPAAAWADAKRTVKPLKRGEMVALGFDGSRKHDATALIACRISDMTLHELKVWERPLSVEGKPLEGWEVPGNEVDAEVAKACNGFKVLRMYGDPPYWQTELDSWARDFGDEVVVKWETNRPKQMAYALEQFLTNVLVGKLFWAEGSDRLTTHVLNANKAENRHGFALTKGRQGEYIDAGVAAVLAHEAARDAIAEGLDQATGLPVFAY